MRTAGGQKNDLRVEREPLLQSPQEASITSILDDEADPPQDDESHDGQVDQPVPPVGHQAVRKEGVAAIVEGRHGVVEGMEEGRRRRKILCEADEQ